MSKTFNVTCNVYFIAAIAIRAPSNQGADYVSFLQIRLSLDEPIVGVIILQFGSLLALLYVYVHYVRVGKM